MKSIQCIQKQRGAALAVGLILLLITTVLGFVAMKGSMLQERMAAGMHNQILAMGGSNSALRNGEQYLYELIGNTNGIDIQGTANGAFFNIFSRYQIPGDASSGLNSSVQSFMENDWGNSLGTEHEYPFNATESLNAKLAEQPRYIIQHLRAFSTAGITREDEGGAFGGGTGTSANQQKAFLVTAKSRSGDGTSFSLVQSLYTVVTD